MSEHQIPRTPHLLLATAAALALAACGGGGGGSAGSTDAPTAASTLSGVASKGPLNGATVCAYAISKGNRGEQLGCSRTDAAGNYSLPVSRHTGDVLVEVSGGTYVDEASGETVNLSGTLRSFARNVEPGFPRSVAVTPLTEVAIALAEASGSLGSAHLDQAVATVQANFGLDDIVINQPADVLSTASSNASPRARAYGLALAAFAQHMRAQGAGATVASVVATVKDDIRAGKFDATSGKALATARDTFVRSTRNRSGETASTVAALLPIQSGGSAATPGATGGGSEAAPVGYGSLVVGGGGAGSSFVASVAYPASQDPAGFTTLSWLDGLSNTLALSYWDATGAPRSVGYGTGWNLSCGGAGCAGVTVDTTARTVTFNNANLPSVSGGTALTLTGTLRY